MILICKGLTTSSCGSNFLTQKILASFETTSTTTLAKKAKSCPSRRRIYPMYLLINIQNRGPSNRWVITKKQPWTSKINTACWTPSATTKRSKTSSTPRKTPNPRYPLPNIPNFERIEHQPETYSQVALAEHSLGPEVQRTQPRISKGRLQRLNPTLRHERLAIDDEFQILLAHEKRG